MLKWKHVTGSADLEHVRNLFRAYAEELEYEICFQAFEKELNDLPGEYAPPTGVLFLVQEQEEPVGCVAIRELEPGICEMKRLYVKPKMRGTGLGKELSMRAIDVAEALGYERIRLDTLSTSETARGLYDYLGFREIGPYGQHRDKQVIFMEKLL